LAGEFSANISLSYGVNSVFQLTFSGTAIGPRIDTIDTDTGAGWSLNINGEGFSAVKGKVMIGKKSAKILSWEDSHIRFALPKLNAGQYELSLSTIAKIKATTSAQLNVHVPKLSSVNKNVVLAKTSLVLTGEYFGEDKPTVYLISDKFKKSAKVLSDYSDTTLQIVVPQLKAGSYKVVVKSNAGSSFDEIYVNVGP
jgi:hypothetical protein